MLTVKQVADRASVSSALVYNWIASGRLAHFRFGKQGSRGSIRVDESDLSEFLLTLRHQAVPHRNPPLSNRPGSQQFKHLNVR
jgi:excisionase family DNA binding protein